VQGYLDGLGHATLLQRPNLQGALCDLMLIAGTPLLDDLAGSSEVLAQTRSREQSNARRHGHRAARADARGDERPRGVAVRCDIAARGVAGSQPRRRARSPTGVA
jgi:hypothetical protein